MTEITMAHHRHEVPVPARFHAKNTEAALGGVEGHALDEARQDLGRAALFMFGHQLDRKNMDLRLKTTVLDPEARDRDRQLEALRTGAALVDEEQTTSGFDLGAM